MAFKIALNAGHGKYTAGKRCLKKLDKNQTREWVLNSRICEKIQSQLKAYQGYELIRLDDVTGEKDIALKTRTNKANEFKADFYLSIHHNAGVNGGTGGGIVAYVYTKPSKKSEEWQDALYNAIIKRTGLKGNRSDGTLKANFHECRESNMPCVLLECGFMDSKTDVPIILTDKFADQVATACVEVLVKKGKLTKKEDEAPIKKPSSIYFKRYLGDSESIVEALKSIGAAYSFSYRKRIAKANGIKLYAGTSKQNTNLLALIKKGRLIKP
jgi:N-acetylmuramoyl-L-alanine amidase